MKWTLRVSPFCSPMNSWNADQYLKFAEERTRPCHDLARRIFVANVRRVIDLGCGPGNSSKVLASCWPKAKLTGLDSSSEMIGAARRNHPQHGWILQDIATWAAGIGGDRFDVVFSNKIS